MRTLFIFLFVAVVSLAISNPGLTDFKSYVQEKAQRELFEESHENLLGKVLAGVGSQVTGAIAARTTERNNYLLFSTYRIAFEGPTGEQEQWRYLGVGGMFFEMEHPRTLDAP